MGKARKNNYTASLTAESFLYDETRTLAEFLSEGSDAETISKRNLAENLISCKRPRALKRLNSILTDRLDEMTDDTLEPLLNNDINNSRITLLYIIYKTDKLVRDFILDVYSDKIITRADRITRVDLGKYFEKVCESEPKMLETSDTTKAKIKSVLARLLTSAGILEKISNDEFRIVRPVISEFTKQSIQHDGGDEFLKALGATL